MSSAWRATGVAFLCESVSTILMWRTLSAWLASSPGTTNNSAAAIHVRSMGHRRLWIAACQCLNRECLLQTCAIAVRLVWMESIDGGSLRASLPPHGRGTGGRERRLRRRGDDAARGRGDPG